MNNIINILNTYKNMYGTTSPFPAVDFTQNNNTDGQDNSGEQVSTKLSAKKQNYTPSPLVVNISEETPKLTNGEFVLTDPSVYQFYRTKPQLSSHTSTDRDMGYRNNNPGNLRGSDGKFRKFSSIEDGWGALVQDFGIKLSGKSKVIKPDASVRDFIYVYAPPHENDSSNYANFVNKTTGINLDLPINTLNPAQVQGLLKSIVKFESPNSYIYLFDRDRYKTVMSSLRTHTNKKGGGILYTNKQYHE